MPSHNTALADDLRDLHEQYIFKVNEAVAAGQSDLALELADLYLDDAQRMIIESEPPSG